MKNFVIIEKLQRIVTGIEAKNIVKYVQDNPGTTKDRIVKYLLEGNICSRMTTLKVIDILLGIGILKDQRKGKYFHSLYINENYDFTILGLILLNGLLNDVEDAYKMLIKSKKFNEIFDKLRSVMNESMSSDPRTEKQVRDLEEFINKM